MLLLSLDLFLIEVSCPQIITDWSWNIMMLDCVPPAFPLHTNYFSANTTAY